MDCSWLAEITWTNVLLAVGGAFLLVLLVRLQFGENRFDVIDFFLDHKDNRASLGALVVAVMAALSVWVVVTLVNRSAPVETLLLGVLGIFVARQAVTAIWGKTPDVPPPPVDGTIPPSTEEGKK